MPAVVLLSPQSHSALARLLSINVAETSIGVSICLGSEGAVSVFMTGTSFVTITSNDVSGQGTLPAEESIPVTAQQEQTAREQFAGADSSTTSIEVDLKDLPPDFENSKLDYSNIDQTTLDQIPSRFTTDKLAALGSNGVCS